MEGRREDVENIFLSFLLCRLWVKFGCYLAHATATKWTVRSHNSQGFMSIWPFFKYLRIY